MIVVNFVFRLFTASVRQHGGGLFYFRILTWSLQEYGISSFSMHRFSTPVTDTE